MSYEKYEENPLKCQIELLTTNPENQIGLMKKKLSLLDLKESFKQAWRTRETGRRYS